MTTDNYTMRVLRAEEGKFLTNSDAGSIIEQVITAEVYLAANDDPRRWVEITAEEAEAIKAAQAAERAEREAAMRLVEPL